MYNKSFKRKSLIIACVLIACYTTAPFINSANSQMSEVEPGESKYWVHPPFTKKNDTRYAGGLNQEEVLTLHQELRALIDIHKAPSKREIEIWKQILKPQWGEWPHIDLRIQDGEICQEGIMADKIWGLGSRCMDYAINLYRFDDQTYLPIISQYADVMMSSLNDDKNGFYYEEDGARPPLFIRLMPKLKEGEAGYKINKYLRKDKFENQEDQEKHDELMLREKECKYEILFHGHTFQGIANAIIWILDHPEIHHLEAPQVPGVKFNSGKTYLEKAKSYLVVMKKAFDYMERHKYFDKNLGVWMELFDNAKTEMSHTQGENGTWNIQYRASPLNRYMIFNNAYLTTGIALNKLDPKQYGLWYLRAKHVAKRGFDFWRIHMVNSKLIQEKHHFSELNQYGSIYYWGYAADRDNTEDQNHLAMELRAMLAMNRWENFLSQEELKAITNMTFSQLYDYKKQQGLIHIGGYGNRTNSNRYDSPGYGSLIGKYMPDYAYEKFMTENLQKWDACLEKRELGHIDVYRMPFEILKARLTRFGKDAWLKL